MVTVQNNLSAPPESPVDHNRPQQVRSKPARLVMTCQQTEHNRIAWVIETERFLVGFSQIEFIVGKRRPWRQDQERNRWVVNRLHPKEQPVVVNRQQHDLIDRHKAEQAIGEVDQLFGIDLDQPKSGGGDLLGRHRDQSVRVGAGTGEILEVGHVDRCGLPVLAADLSKQLFAVNLHRPRGINAYTHLVATKLNNRHRDVAANDNGLASLPAQDQHGQDPTARGTRHSTTLTCMRWMRAQERGQV